MVSWPCMRLKSLLQGLKRFFFALVGSRLYRLLHALLFLARLLLALACPPYRPAFFGRDMLSLADTLKPGDTVLDIGAYLGGTAVLFARKVGSTGRVIAFEPFHHAFLRFLVRMLRLPVRVVPAALGAEAGHAEFVVPLHAGVPLYSQAGFPDSFAAVSGDSAYRFQRLEAPRETLDGFLAREGIAPSSVAAAKIDVEGAELAVLRGAGNFFRGFRGPLVCEFWFNEIPPKGWSWLRERGFACRKADRSGRWLPADTPAALAQLARGETYGNFWFEKPRD
jgi:FkbM family methyltransferase